MRIEVWSDVVCPWCYIGKRRLEEALAAFAHRDEVEVVYRSFELDPTAPQVGTETVADPEVGGVSPTMTRMVVDLPAPLGPRNPVTRPGAAVKETWSTACRPP